MKARAELDSFREEMEKEDAATSTNDAMPQKWEFGEFPKALEPMVALFRFQEAGFNSADETSVKELKTERELLRARLLEIEHIFARLDPRQLL